MANDFVEGFNSIIKKLNGLNEVREFNGNLEDSIRFSTEVVGRRARLVVSFVGQLNHLRVDNHLQGNRRLAEGLRVDLNDLRAMVNRVASKFVRPHPEDLVLFNNIEYAPPQQWGHHQPAYLVREMMKLCFANYSHPLFFTKSRWAKFVYKCHEIEKRNRRNFRNIVSLDAAPVDMRGWVNGIPIKNNYAEDSPLQSPLCQVLYKREILLPVHQQINNQQHPFDERFRKAKELPNYLRIVLEHGRDLNHRRWYGKNLAMLRDHFPGVLAKVHYSLWTQLKDDTTCRSNFGAELIKMLRHGTFGYKGFKF